MEIQQRNNLTGAERVLFIAAEICNSSRSVNDSSLSSMSEFLHDIVDLRRM